MSDDNENDNDNNGAGSLQEMALQAATENICEVLAHLAPHLPDDAAIELAMNCAAEQMGAIPMGVMPTIFDETMRAKFPTFFASIKKQGDEDRAAVVKAAKSLEKVIDPGHAIQTAMIFALLLTPAARALLRAYGFEVTFGQSPEAPAGQIILSS